MPNWCNNTLYLEHDDPAMIERAVNAFNRGELLNEFVPIPAELKDVDAPNREANRDELIAKHGAADWYDFCCNNWGTKWDVGGTGDITISEDGTSITMYFDSAWSPPVVAYDRLTELGYKVYAMYYEGGSCFAGIYDEFGDNCYSLTDMSADEVADAIPPELDVEFNIVEMMREFEEPEPFTEWYKQGVKDTGLDK